MLAVLTPLIPLLPFASSLGFVRRPATLTGSIIMITALYVATTEFAKQRFYRWDTSRITR